MESRADAARAQREKDKQTIRRKDREIARLHRMKAAQAERVRAARDAQAQAVSERDALRRTVGESQFTVEEFETTKAKLEEGRTAYRDLLREHHEVLELLEKAGQERKNLQSVVRDWDRMCSKLAKVPNPDRLSDRQKESIRMWKNFRAGMRQTAATNRASTEGAA